MRYAFWVIFLLFVWLKPALTQTGLPLLKNYDSQNLGTQSAVIWDVVQDKSGVLYLANNSGILVYDGRYFKLIPTSAPARSLALDDKGKIYVGCISDFGVIEVDQWGNLDYVSKRKIIGKTNLDLGWVDRVVIINGIPHYISQAGIFKVQKKDDGLDDIAHIVPPNKLRLAGGGMLNNDLVVYVEDKGLYKLSGNQLVPLNAAGFTGFGISHILAISANKYFLVDENHDMFIYQGGSFRPFDIAGFNNKKIDDVGLLKSGKLAIGTELGVAIVDENGNVVLRIDQSTGLPTTDIHSLFVDNQGGLWICHKRGLTRVTPEIKITNFPASVGVVGKINDVVRFNGNVYIATSTGTYQLDGNTPRILAGMTYESYSFHSTDNSLFVATYNGLKNITAGTPIGVSLTKNPEEDIKASKVGPGKSSNRVWVAHEEGVSLLVNNGGWVLDTSYGRLTKDQAAVEANSVIELSDGTVWAGTIVNGVARLKPGQKPIYYDSDNGLPGGALHVFKHNDKVYVWSENRGYFKLNASGNFEPAPGLNAVSENKIIPYCKVAPDNALWFYSDNGVVIGKFDGEKIEKLPASLAYILKSKPTAFFHEKDGSQTWVAFFDKLIRINGNHTETPNQPFSTYVREVVAGDSTLLEIAFADDKGEYSYEQSETNIRAVPYRLNTFVINVAGTSFDFEEGNEYQFKLDGLDDKWSPWLKRSDLIFNNLREGSYKLTVRCKNAFGVIGKEATYEFTVKAPWYRHIVAYFTYLVLLGVGIWGLIRLNAKRLEAANKKLEATVQERTREIASKNIELEKQKEIIEAKNEDLLASITYARRIQEALLPSRELVAKYLPNSFIMFKPRDIVSGDFYWFFTKGDKFLLAVGDCTGHGVPGAFMTVMGINLLNQIARDVEDINPATILGRLDEAVRVTLKQEGAGDRPQDGMDVSLVLFDKNSDVVKIASANRPIYHLQMTTGEIVEIKGTKASIGGYMVVPFELNEVKIEKNDLIYLFSDGVTDQFGGPQGRKWTPKRFREVIMSVYKNPPEAQCPVFEKAFEDWKGKYPQTDDVVLVGIKNV